MLQTFLPLTDCGAWIQIKDGDERGNAIYRRHYSARHYKNRCPKLFVGPGEKMVLITANCDALFVWRKFRSMDNQTGVNCAVFRNESGLLSSRLINEAVQMARQRWPHERLYTYVNPGKVQSNNPGYCFKVSGWTIAGHTKRGLLILELLSA